MADKPCPRCAAHDQAVPTEVQLRQLLSEDGLETEKFVPLAGTGEQATALAAYAHAVSLMLAAFGIEITGARINRTWGMLRVHAQLGRIMNRVDDARLPIQTEIRGRFDSGEIGATQANVLAMEAPTPDYDGRERDEAWLQRVLGVGVDAV